MAALSRVRVRVLPSEHPLRHSLSHTDLCGLVQCQGLLAGRGQRGGGGAGLDGDRRRGRAHAHQPGAARQRPQQPGRRHRRLPRRLRRLLQAHAVPECFPCCLGFPCAQGCGATHCSLSCIPEHVRQIRDGVWGSFGSIASDTLCTRISANQQHDTKACRLRTRRRANSFEQWDSLAAALRPLLRLECDGDCSEAEAEAEASGSAISGDSTTVKAAGAAGGGVGRIPPHCRLVMPLQASSLSRLSTSRLSLDTC